MFLVRYELDLYTSVYSYGNLALQVGGVSNETVKYGREFCGTSTKSDCSGKAQKQLYSKL
jgi:hypothetical protein